MIRFILLLNTVILGYNTLSAQYMYKSVSSSVKFTSEAAWERIEAHNTQASAMLNIQKQEIAVLVPIVGFGFANGKMQEHFNENYMESDKYPFASFKGRFSEEINWDKEGRAKVRATGKMLLHGVEQTVNIDGYLSVTPNQRVVLDADFDIHLAKYKISIPTILWKKLAEHIHTHVVITFLPHAESFKNVPTKPQELEFVKASN
jgi:polyisoprenoid-binding protein YceI